MSQSRGGPRIISNPKMKFRAVCMAGDCGAPQFRQQPSSCERPAVPGGRRRPIAHLVASMDRDYPVSTLGRCRDVGLYVGPKIPLPTKFQK